LSGLIVEDLLQEILVAVEGRLPHAHCPTPRSSSPVANERNCGRKD
jgi:hypothetical protein